MSRPTHTLYVSPPPLTQTRSDDLTTVGPGSETVNYHKPGFLAKFLELQGVMWQTNQGLTDRHAYDSRPSAWPILRRGIVSGALVARVVMLTLGPPGRTFGSKNRSRCT